jgi:RNA polymerase sigma factor (sigma-70 family)
MDQERILVDKILNGDLQAFQQFIEKYQRLVTHMVFRMILNESDREEICQDVFLKVYQNLSKFEFQSKLSTWISKITYNTCMNYLQKKKALLYDDLKIRENESDSAIFEHSPSNLDSVKGEVPLPDETVISQEISEMLYVELNNLPAQYRTMITLYHLDNLSYDEIGEIMGMPMGTVKNYLFRARKLLKEKLLEKYTEGEFVK